MQTSDSNSFCYSHYQFHYPTQDSDSNSPCYGAVSLFNAPLKCSPDGIGLFEERPLPRAVEELGRAPDECKPLRAGAILALG